MLRSQTQGLRFRTNKPSQLTDDKYVIRRRNKLLDRRQTTDYQSEAQSPGLAALNKYRSGDIEIAEK